MKRIVLLTAVLAYGVLTSGCVVDDDGEDLGVTEQEVTVNDTLPTSGSKTVSVAVYPGAPSDIIMSSPSSGNWKFETYGSPISLGGCSAGDFIVYTYWRDTSVSSTWNYWPGGGPVCYPTSGWSTNLYSGSSTIQYKFEYYAYGGYGETVYAKFTKQ
ncbi:MAG: hypothetical protein QY323_01745 [Patescibacteria group bacterium]|nr:MAG: hypothetical protein QY323_01745 [Patescibacteria group bacterium]